MIATLKEVADQPFVVPENGTLCSHIWQDSQQHLRTDLVVSGDVDVEVTSALAGLDLGTALQWYSWTSYLHPTNTNLQQEHLRKSSHPSETFQNAAGPLNVLVVQSTTYDKIQRIG